MSKHGKYATSSRAVTWSGQCNCKYLNCDSVKLQQACFSKLYIGFLPFTETTSNKSLCCKSWIWSSPTLCQHSETTARFSSTRAPLMGKKGEMKIYQIWIIYTLSVNIFREILSEPVVPLQCPGRLSSLVHPMCSPCYLLCEPLRYLHKNHICICLRFYNIPGT